ncbi:MAG: SPFH domain-containing protein [Thermoguttaceae bacterium]
MVDDYVIEPGQVGVVTCKLGDPLPSGDFLVDGDIGDTQFKGVLRKVLGPGRYRINPYGYEVKVVKTEEIKGDQTTKYSGWVQIPTGYVGVVTNLADNPEARQRAGVQDVTLPPGIYPMNPREQQVDLISVGYTQTTISADKVKDDSGALKLDEAGEPLVSTSENKGINFPAADGFPILMEFTAVWGLMPNQCAHAVRTFGTLKQVEKKIVMPQIESICRNHGSRFKGSELLVGEKREEFQTEALAAFKKILTEKKISLLYGLVRHTYIPIEVRKPIQSAFIADELKLTREEEEKTAKEEASFKEAKQKVELATMTVEADTLRMAATRTAEGDRDAKRIEAETKRLTAAIQKQTALLKAQAKTIVGEAENKGKTLVEQAKADKFRLAVMAFGSAGAYNNWVFANGLPENVDLRLFYAGQGTLWTDIKNFSPALLVDPGNPAKKPQPKE